MLCSFCVTCLIEYFMRGKSKLVFLINTCPLSRLGTLLPALSHYASKCVRVAEHGVRSRCVCSHVPNSFALQFYIHTSSDIQPLHIHPHFEEDGWAERTRLLYTRRISAELRTLTLNTSLVLHCKISMDNSALILICF